MRPIKTVNVHLSLHLGVTMTLHGSQRAGTSAMLTLCCQDYCKDSAVITSIALYVCGSNVIWEVLLCSTIA